MRRRRTGRIHVFVSWHDLAQGITWLLYAPALVVLLLYGWGFLVHAWSVVSDPYQIDYGELPELNRAALLAQGRPIYVDWSRPPYQMANYTPLYSAVAAAGVALSGPHFFSGRAISLASTLLTGVCIGAAARGLGAGWLGAIAGGLLYFALYPPWNWGAFQRVDAFAVALETLGMAVFCLGWVRARRPGAAWASVPLFLAAVYARQTVAAGAFACYLYLVLTRPRLGAAVAGAYAAGGLAIFGLLQLATAGQFWRHIVAGNLNRWTWERVDSFWQPFWRLLHWLAISTAVAGLAAALRRQAQVPLLYVVASAATAITIGKIGSEVNYLLQLCVALCLLAGLAIDQISALMSRLGRSNWYEPALALGNAVLALWLLVGLQQAYHVPYVVERGQARLLGPAALFGRLRWAQRPLWRLDPLSPPSREIPDYYRTRYRADPSATEREDARRGQEYVARLTGDVLSEDMAFTVTAGKRVYLQPFEFTQLAEQGEFDQRPILEDIKQKRFVAVVLRFRIGTDPGTHIQRINRPMIDAVDEAYRLDATFGSYFIYRPR